MTAISLTEMQARRPGERFYRVAWFIAPGRLRLAGLTKQHFTVGQFEVRFNRPLTSLVGESS